MYMTTNLAIPAFEPSPAPAELALEALYAGHSLGADQAEALFAELVAGRLAEPSIAALLIAQHGRLELLSRILWYLPVLCFVLAMFGAPVASLVLTFALWKVYTDTRPAAQQVARNEVAETKLPVSAPA